MKTRFLFLAFIVFGVVIPITLLQRFSPTPEGEWWEPNVISFLEVEWWESGVILLLWAVTLLIAVYDFHLWRIAKTAVFTLDMRSIGYHDCYIKSTIAWNDAIELAPSRIRAVNGRTIFLKLGITMIEEWETFTETVVKSAGLCVIPHGNGPARFWAKPMTGMKRAA